MRKIFKFLNILPSVGVGPSTAPLVLLKACLFRNQELWVRYPTSSSLSYHPDVIPANNAYGVTIQVIGVKSIAISKRTILK